ncbi:hypothetical protein [Phyllobacterium myrsinacearum]|uniref:Putative membrane protein n=1 Tax=Phyllobacterium myrsinacearum TaxID=28101 RepID=A0A839EFA0_9HYPH|nr:hypothetical protein [Phyllobacterium myrsinacearum]MBA8878813.1 putative membrane protein [Phyllobacterium myrsinacearum]
MAKRIGILIFWLIVLVPVCVFLGYLIGYLIAPVLFSDKLHPDFYEHDRELYAGIYGIMFTGGFLYLVSVSVVVFRFIKSVRR